MFVTGSAVDVQQNNNSMHCNVYKLVQEIVVQEVYGKTIPELEQDLWEMTKCQWKVTRVKYISNFGCSAYCSMSEHWHWIIQRITV